MDRTNYARWIPIRTRDVQVLPSTVEDYTGRLGDIPKTHNFFSPMPTKPLSPEKNNVIKLKDLKIDGLESGRS